MPLSDKDDGTKYSKVLRRVVTLVELLPEEKSFSLSGISEEVNTNSKYKEFYNARTDEQITARRIQDYLRYLSLLHITERLPEKANYKLVYSKPGRDEDWVQQLSDKGLDHLSTIAGIQPDELLNKMRGIIESSLTNQEVPTIKIITRSFNIDHGRTEEVFKWSLYIFLDSPICPFILKRNPYIINR